MPESWAQELAAGPAKQKAASSWADELASGPKAAAPSTDSWAAQLGGAQAGEVPALEAQAQAVGAPAPAQDSPGVFRRILDVLQRGDFAAAGAAEELFTPQGGGITAVPGRVGRELFSGVGGLQGKKHTFGQVLEEAGVPQLGSFSDLLPGLYNQAGEGWQFQKGGWADPTGRGAVGLALDIFADPTTYIGAGVAGKFGKVAGGQLTRAGGELLGQEFLKATENLSVRAAAIKAAKEADPALTSLAANQLIGRGSAAAPVLRELARTKAKEAVQAAIDAGRTDLLDKGGIKWAGIHVADNPLKSLADSGFSQRLTAALANNGAGAQVFAAGRWMKKNITDPLANLFVKGWGIKGLEGARPIIDDALDKKGYLQYLMNEDIKASPLARYVAMSPEKRAEIFKPVIDAFEKGGVAAVPDEFKPAMAYYAGKMKQMHGEEVASGLLTPQQYVDNYFAHYYHNDPEELQRAIYAFKGAPGSVNSMVKMGRNAEERAYETLAQAASDSARRNGLDKSVPVLAPVYDPIDSLTRRWDHSITKRVQRELVSTLESKFGQLPFNPAEAWDLASPASKLAAPEAAKVQAILDSSTAAASGAKRPTLTPELNAALDELDRLKNLALEATRNDITGKYGAVPAEGLPKALTAARVRVNEATAAAMAPGAKAPKEIDKVAAVRNLSNEARREFFRQRFQQIESRAEAAGVLNKYDQFSDFFPKVVNYGSDFAADGSRFIKFNAGNFEATLPETLAKELEGMSDKFLQNRSLRTLLEGYDKVNNFWKGSVTWLFPSFHVRNAYSNVAQAFVDIGIGALNPASYKQTAEILFGKGPGQFVTKMGTYTYDEVRQILNRYGINTSAEALAEFTGRGLRPARTVVGKGFEKARNVGTAIENESRAQLALNYLRRGMDPIEVGQRVKKFELDYRDGLTNFERTWMKRIIPFYTFQRLNLGLMVDNLLKRPGMALAQVKPFAGREDENSMMTSWNAGALKIRLNRDGRNVQMITGVDLPIRNLDLLFRGNVRDTLANWIGMLSPALKTPIELAANKSLFTGNEFDRATSNTLGVMMEQMPKPMQQWMGYKKETDAAGRPKYTFDGQRFYLVAQSFIASRFLSTSDRQWRLYLSQANPSVAQSSLDFLTGLRYQDMNLDDEQQKRLKERQRDLENALVRWGERKQFTRSFTPRSGR